MEYGALHALFQGARGLFGLNRCVKGCTGVVRCTMGAREWKGRAKCTGLNVLSLDSRNQDVEIAAGFRLALAAWMDSELRVRH